MDEEEAILQMELLGHEFYLYKDIEIYLFILLKNVKDSAII